MICGKMPHHLKAALLQYVDEIIETNPEDRVEAAIQCHADISVCPLSDKKIIISPMQTAIKDKLISLGFCVIISKNIISPYPNDCLLNVLVLDDIVILNRNIYNYAKCGNKSKQITVNQGYIKCATIPVAHNAIITDDPSIAKQATGNDIDVCFVEKGDVRLPGYPYGFIGGCCGKISERKIAFCGNIEHHRDSNEITAFLKKYGVQVVNLSDEPLLDVGSLIPLTQERMTEYEEEY